MRRGGHAGCLCLGQHRVGGHNGDRRCLTGADIKAGKFLNGRVGAHAPTAEFGTYFEWGCPEIRIIANRRRPKCVDGHQRANRDVAHAKGCRAKPPFKIGRGGAGSCPMSAKRKVGPCSGKGGGTKCGIRVFGPGFVTTVKQIKQDRAGDDRDALILDGKATTLIAQGLPHAIGTSKSQRRSARQHQRVHLGDQLVRCQQFGIGRSWCTAHHMKGSHERRVGSQHGYTCSDVVVRCVPDKQARDVGYQISGSCDHVLPPLLNSDSDLAMAIPAGQPEQCLTRSLRAVLWSRKAPSGSLSAPRGTMGFLRLFLMFLIFQTVVFVSVYYFLRAARRERLERDYPDIATERERSAFVDARVRAYAVRIRRWLALVVYGVPWIGLALIIYLTNFK